MVITIVAFVCKRSDFYAIYRENANFVNKKAYLPKNGDLIMADDDASHKLEFDIATLRRKRVVCLEVDYLPYTSPDYTFMTNEMVIGICLNGSAAIYYDMQQVTFSPLDISVMLPDHILSGGTWTADYKALLVVVSRDYYDELIHYGSFRNFHKYRYRPCFHLNDEQFERIAAVLKVLQIIADCDHSKKLNMMNDMFDVLFYALSKYRNEEVGDESAADGILFQRFYDLLTENHSKEHEVAWYAGKLCLTPKYFSTVIKKTTGRSAGEWISIVLSLRAKSLLDSYQELTVTEIADSLGFSSKSAFCRFFRRMNGMSPTEYRGSLLQKPQKGD